MTNMAEDLKAEAPFAGAGLAPAAEDRRRTQRDSPRNGRSAPPTPSSTARWWCWWWR